MHLMHSAAARQRAITPPKRFPYCIVWTPIPVLTWLLPFVGHIGICLSSGIILDFAGSYYVAMDALAFGNPTKYCLLDPELPTFPQDEPAAPTSTRSTSAHWDKALQACTSLYQLKPYSLLSQNCHNFVGHFLNQVNYDKKVWTVVEIASTIFLKGQYVSSKGIALTWLPHATFVASGTLLGGMVFLLCYIGVVVAAGCIWAYVVLQAQSAQGPGVVGLV